jgi:hypothetical protein
MQAEAGIKSFFNHSNGGPMKKILVLTLVALLPLNAYAGGSAKMERSAITHTTETARRTSSTMVKNEDGELKANEYEVISTNDSIFRAFCPYTCAMRGLEAKYCKTWRSLIDPKLCYVQDTRIPSNAIKWGRGGQGE